jgi:lipopolysaccharide heptosyltransferase I
MESQFKNILIIKPSSLGDVVHALPALGALRRAFPEAKITWMIRREFAPLLECVKGLDEVLLFERKALGRWYAPSGWAAMRALLGRLRGGHYDLVLDLQGLLRTAVFSRLSGCPVRVGMADARELAPLFYTHKVRPPDGSLHMADRYRAALAAVGAGEMDMQVALDPPVTAVEHVQRLLAEAGLAEGCFAVLIPGAAHESKRWPIERFAAAAERLVRDYGLAVAAVGTAGEQRIVSALQQVSAVPITDWTGRTTIPQLVAVLQRAALVVSNDTGPGHIAVAAQTPTVLVFGPTNPQWVGPYHQPDAVVAVEPEQRGKAVRSRNPDHRIERVSVQAVMAAIGRRLRQGSGEQSR